MAKPLGSRTRFKGNPVGASSETNWHRPLPVSRLLVALGLDDPKNLRWRGSNWINLGSGNSWGIDKFKINCNIVVIWRAPHYLIQPIFHCYRPCISRSIKLGCRSTSWIYLRGQSPRIFLTWSRSNWAISKFDSSRRIISTISLWTSTLLIQEYKLVQISWSQVKGLINRPKWRRRREKRDEDARYSWAIRKRLKLKSSGFMIQVWRHTNGIPRIIWKVCE